VVKCTILVGIWKGRFHKLAFIDECYLQGFFLLFFKSCTLCNLGNKRVACFANMSHPEVKSMRPFFLSLFVFGVYLETCIIISVNIGFQHARDNSEIYWWLKNFVLKKLTTHQRIKMKILLQLMLGGCTLWGVWIPILKDFPHYKAMSPCKKNVSNTISPSW